MARDEIVLEKNKRETKRDRKEGKPLIVNLFDS